jgi:DNA-binding protein HU-beta
MNKGQLVNKMALGADITKASAERVLTSITLVIAEELGKKEDVALFGFGTFSAVQRAARIGRNPKTGEPIEIAASVAAKFKPGKTLRDALN